MRSLHPWPIFPTNLDPAAARSLSLQMVLQELSSSFEVSSSFRALAADSLPPEEKNTQILALLEKLRLFSLENPFAQKGGTLDKLCFYCAILLQASSVGGQEILSILEEMRNALLQFRSKIFGWGKKAPVYSPDALCSFLLDLYGHLHLKLSRFFKALYPFFQEADTDENVLVYLIEQKSALNFYLGDRAIEELLCRLFPEGKDPLRSTVAEGYIRRGFASFFARIEPLIDSLELEVICSASIAN